MSEIMAAKDPLEASRKLSMVVKKFHTGSPPIFSMQGGATAVIALLTSACYLLNVVRETGPLVHQVHIYHHFIPCANTEQTLPLLSRSPITWS